MPLIRKKEEFIYEFYEHEEKEVDCSDCTTEKILVEKVIATIDERELGNKLLMMTNELKNLININNAIVNYRLAESLKVKEE